MVSGHGFDIDDMALISGIPTGYTVPTGLGSYSMGWVPTGLGIMGADQGLGRALWTAPRAWIESPPSAPEFWLKKQKTPNV